ncbi:hypothetical protein FRC19_003024 [Serendipita sp. 401]|nr:hypothetical protein FRC19_003024 [Serendipita sp. 401]KAG9042490.1 hypothetical protein FS842_002170 [Serendipita sp. 407]
MALTLVSLAVLATTAMAAPMPQLISALPQIISALSPTPTTSIRCKAQIISQKDDTCRSIGLPWGLNDYQILEANSFLNCEDIWIGTPICIPDIHLPSTVVLPTVTTAASTSSSSVTGTTAPCLSWYYSVYGDTCDRIAGNLGVSRDVIYNSNTFLNCDDIWVNTPICLPFLQPSRTLIAPPAATTVATTVPSSPSPTCRSIIISAPGQTCDSIARDTRLVGSDILDANPFLNCNDIWPGTQICAPPTSNIPGCKHWVVVNSSMAAPGHSVTCSDVARPWVLDPTDIYNSNTFVNCEDIWPGTQICIPWKTFY